MYRRLCGIRGVKGKEWIPVGVRRVEERIKIEVLKRLIAIAEVETEVEIVVLKVAERRDIRVYTRGLRLVGRCF